MSISAIRPHVSSHLSTSFCPSPGSACADADASKRSARMYVAATTASSSVFSPTRFCSIACTAAAGVIALIGRYLSRPQRATHSWNSPKSSTHPSSVASACAAPSLSPDCESMKCDLTVGIESFHLWTMRVRGSPEMSDSWCTSHWPMWPRSSKTSRICRMPSLSEMTFSLVSSAQTLVYHALSFSSYRSSTSMTAASFITVSRNCADVSRRALGSTNSSSIVSRQPGSPTIARVSPKLPKVGLARWKEMRTSIAMNSYSTSSWSFLASLPSLVPLTFSISFLGALPPLASALPSLEAALRRPSACCSRTAAELVALALMKVLVISANDVSLVMRPHSLTKSWNSPISISMASSAEPEPPIDLQ